MEVCINNAWGTVCNRLFSPEDAATACQQLGGFHRESKYNNVLPVATWYTALMCVAFSHLL